MNLSSNPFPATLLPHSTLNPHFPYYSPTLFPNPPPPLANLPKPLPTPIPPKLYLLTHLHNTIYSTLPLYTPPWLPDIFLPPPPHPHPPHSTLFLPIHKPVPLSHYYLLTLYHTSNLLHTPTLHPISTLPHLLTDATLPSLSIFTTPPQPNLPIPTPTSTSLPSHLFIHPHPTLPHRQLTHNPVYSLPNPFVSYPNTNGLKLITPPHSTILLHTHPSYYHSLLSHFLTLPQHSTPNLLMLPLHPTPTTFTLNYAHTSNSTPFPSILILSPNTLIT